MPLQCEGQWAAANDTVDLDAAFNERISSLRLRPFRSDVRDIELIWLVQVGVRRCPSVRGKGKEEIKGHRALAQPPLQPPPQIPSRLQPEVRPLISPHSPFGSLQPPSLHIFRVHDRARKQEPYVTHLEVSVSSSPLSLTQRRPLSPSHLPPSLLLSSSNHPGMYNDSHYGSVTDVPLGPNYTVVLVVQVQPQPSRFTRAARWVRRRLHALNPFGQQQAPPPPQPHAGDPNLNQAFEEVVIDYLPTQTWGGYGAFEHVAYGVEVVAPPYHLPD